MSDKRRVELTRGTSDHDDTPFVDGARDGAKPRKTSKSRLPAAKSSEAGFREWFEQAFRLFASPPAALVMLDVHGRVSFLSIAGDADWSRLLENLRFANWENMLSAADRTHWRDYHKALGNVPKFDRQVFGLRLGQQVRSMIVTACRVTATQTWIWLQPAETKPLSDAGVKYWAGVFAHEINAPLASVLTTAQAARSLLTASRPPLAEIRDGMDALVERVKQTADIVRRLRSLAGGERPRRVSADLAAIVGQVAHDLVKDRSRLTMVLPENGPAVMVDAVQIAQVVNNLVRNALEAMDDLPPSKRRLTLSVRYEADEVIASVEDQGPGLSVDQVGRLFSPVASTKPDGMGLGLAVCRQIVEAHGGRIWATANSPQGCLFSFALPYSTEEP